MSLGRHVYRGLVVVLMVGMLGCGVKGNPIPYVKYQEQLKKERAQQPPAQAPKKESK